MHSSIGTNYQPVQLQHTPRTPIFPISEHMYIQQACQTFERIQNPLPQFCYPITQQNKYIGNYIIDYNRRVGNGNFSHVYTAINQRQPNTKLAVKVINTLLLRQQNLQHLVKSEVQILLAARHQNILICKDIFWDEIYCYIFTEFCEGGSLQTKIKNSMAHHMPILKRNHSGIMQNSLMNSVESLNLQTNSNYRQKNEIYPCLTEGEMLPLIKDVFMAMLYLQKQNIIHRDVKAANIFLKQNRAIVADFGFARYVHEPFIDLNIGSLPYMPPEALSKNLYSNKTDVWAFGVLVYEIFHGESPYAKSHDTKELLQKVYTPLSIARIRNDLSNEIKELILACLEIDIEKRKKFSEIQQTWFYKKLFGTVEDYTYGYNIIRSKNSNMNNQIAFGVNFKNGQNKQHRNFLCASDKLNSRIIIQNGRSFGSRFKEKIHIGSSSKNMNYTNQGDNFSQNQNSNCVINSNYKIPQYSNPEKKENQFIATERSVSPKNLRINVYRINFTASSPTKQPKSPIPTPSNQINPLPSIKNELLNKPHPTPNQIIQKRPSNLASTPTEAQKISFKNILLRIQEIRNYYKLAILLKDQNVRLTEIKNRLLIKSFKEMKKIQRLVDKDLIDLSTYDKNRQKANENLMKESKNNTNISNRKAKLSTIIKDYKMQFENQLKRRQLNISNDTCIVSSGFFLSKSLSFDQTPKNIMQKTSSVEQQTNKGSNANQNIVKGETLINFKNKAPSLSQDIQYVIQTQLLYHVEETVNENYEQCQVYRNKVKQILQDIMHVQHGQVSIESKKTNSRSHAPNNSPNHQNLPTSQTTTDTNNSKLNMQTAMLQKQMSMHEFNSKYDHLDQLSRIKCKQKSTHN